MQSMQNIDFSMTRSKLRRLSSFAAVSPVPSSKSPKVTSKSELVFKVDKLFYALHSMLLAYLIVLAVYFSHKHNAFIFNARIIHANTRYSWTATLSASCSGS